MPARRKRSDERVGHAHEAKDAAPDVDQIQFERQLVPPEPNPAWQPIAMYAWISFLESPLNEYYTETDLTYGWMTCEAIDTAIKSGMSAMRVQAADSMMKSALFNEDARRRVRIELVRKEPEPNQDAQKNRDDLEARRRERDRGVAG